MFSDETKALAQKYGFVLKYIPHTNFQRAHHIVFYKNYKKDIHGQPWLSQSFRRERGAIDFMTNLHVRLSTTELARFYGMEAEHITMPDSWHLLFPHTDSHKIFKNKIELRKYILNSIEQFPYKELT